jgi:hypothetical protein
MQFENQSPGGPSLRLLITSEDGEATCPAPPVANTGTARAGQSRASRWRLRSHLEVVDRPEADDRLGNRDPAIQISSGRNPSRGPILGRNSLAGIEAVRGFTARGIAAVAGVLLAAISWTIAQILEGCAEYCQAMYPIFVEPDEPVGRHDAASTPQSGQRVANHLQGQETAARRTMTPSHHTRFTPTAMVHARAFHIQAVDAEALARLPASRTMPRGWRASITSPVAAFWLRLRREREIRRTIMALRALGDPASRKVEMSRHRTERATSLADRCE